MLAAWVTNQDDVLGLEVGSGLVHDTPRIDKCAHRSLGRHAKCLLVGAYLISTSATPHHSHTLQQHYLRPQALYAAWGFEKNLSSRLLTFKISVSITIMIIIVIVSIIFVVVIIIIIVGVVVVVVIIIIIIIVLLAFPLLGLCGCMSLFSPAQP